MKHILTPNKHLSLVDNSSIRDVRGRGLMFAVDLADEQSGNAIFNALLQSGYIVCNRKSLFRRDPALIMRPHEFDELVTEFSAIVTS